MVRDQSQSLRRDGGSALATKESWSVSRTVSAEDAAVTKGRGKAPARKKTVPEVGVDWFGPCQFRRVKHKRSVLLKHGEETHLSEGSQKGDLYGCPERRTSD